MAQKNIVLKGTTYNGVESITLPVSGGGDATFVETSDANAVAADIAQDKTAYVNGSKITGTASGGGGNWSWMGENPTKVQTCLNEKVYLKDSAYATWTPTTTNTTLISATNLTAYTSVDFSTYDYIAFYRFHAHYEYTSAINPHLTDGYFTGAYCIYGYSENYNAITNDTVTNVTSASSSKYSSFYVNSSGNNTYGVSVGQGVYMSSLSGPTVSTSSITLKVPTIYARCNNTYFPTTAADAVDQGTSYYEQVIELWKVDRETSMNSAINSYIRDMWINGL